MHAEAWWDAAGLSRVFRGEATASDKAIRAELKRRRLDARVDRLVAAAKAEGARIATPPPDIDLIKRRLKAAKDQSAQRIKGKDKGESHHER